MSATDDPSQGFGDAGDDPSGSGAEEQEHGDPTEGGEFGEDPTEGGTGNGGEDPTGGEEFGEDPTGS
jgi:hypothetical protein